MSWVMLVGVILGGRVFSWGIYRTIWSLGEEGFLKRFGVIGGWVGKWWIWPVSGIWVVMMWGESWESLEMVRLWAVAGCGILAVSAVGRAGEGRGGFFILDRLLVVALAGAVWIGPGWVYPAVLAACCLQYAGAGWGLSPGYSNLLGFEFVRGSLAVLMVGLLVGGEQGLLLAGVLAYQAAYYAMQAVAKSALGRHWWSWIAENRVECLVMNAHLRGWCGEGWRKAVLFRVVGILRRNRRWACGAGWVLELGWLGVLIDHRFAFVWLALTAGFHLMVFFLTGLLAWQFVVSHGVMMVCLTAGWFGGTPAMVGGGCGILAMAWVGWVRGKIAVSAESGNGLGRGLAYSDAADLLMAWWDGPLMRFYRWEGETVDGRRVALPVTMFAPYDTVITDFPTHLMVLGLHRGLDPRVAIDRKVARTGVWGLLIDLEERDFLYRLMDEGKEEPKDLRAPSVPEIWEGNQGKELPDEGEVLRDFFRALNRDRGNRWARLVRRWPHFPGEDLVPDWCPLIRDLPARDRFERPLKWVQMRRVRTWQTRDGAFLLEDEPVWTFLLE